MSEQPSMGQTGLPETPAGFAELGVSEPIRRTLRLRGIEVPFEIQTRVIPDALAGRDDLAESVRP